MADLLDSDTRRAARLHETLTHMFDQQEKVLHDKLEVAMKEEDRLRSDLKALNARRKMVLNNLENMDLRAVEAVDFLFFGTSKFKAKEPEVPSAPPGEVQG